MERRNRKSELTSKMEEFATFPEPAFNKKVDIDLQVYLGENARWADKIYVVGNVQELGGWNIVKAKPLREANGKYVFHFNVEPNTNVEFKVCKGKSWNEVEKGIFGEEICNHSIFATSNQNYNLEVYNWNS